MAIGPLTNLALATSLDPKFPERLKSLTIMGGNMYSLGMDSNKFFFNLLYEECLWVYDRKYRRHSFRIQFLGWSWRKLCHSGTNFPKNWALFNKEYFNCHFIKSCKLILKLFFEREVDENCNSRTLLKICLPARNDRRNRFNDAPWKFFQWNQFDRKRTLRSQVSFFQKYKKKKIIVFLI